MIISYPRLVLSLVWLMIVIQNNQAEDNVTVLKTPHGGIQPQAVVDPQGTLHLIYFKGEAKAGDLFYVRRKSKQKEFTGPLRVNSVPGSAIAMGTVRGGQLAIGKAGRVHVAWNGSGQNGGMLYARLNEAGTAFEEQRNLMRKSTGADGGCTLAATTSGHVIVAWHGLVKGDKGEDHRMMWLARSTDEGKTFASESPAWHEPTGACGCCSTRGFVDREGSIYFLYRSATGGDNRDIYLLNLSTPESDVQGMLVHTWKIATCPMSTFAFAEGPQGVVAAWDTNGQIFCTTIKPGTVEVAELKRIPVAFNARHPSLAFNAEGQSLIAWTEGTGWQRGGALVWQLFDKKGKPVTLLEGRLDRGIPVWGLPAVVAIDNAFIIIH